MATLFLHSHHTRKGVQQRVGYIGFTLALFIFTSTEALPIFLSERQIFIRETSRGAYRASTYTMAQAAVILPFLFVLATIYSLISYFAIGLVTNAGAFFFFVLILFLTLAVSNALVSFVGSIVPDYSAGQSLATAICSYFFLFSGFFIMRYIPLHNHSYLYTNHSAYTSFFAVLPSTTGENKSFQESVFSSLITIALYSWTSFRL